MNRTEARTLAEEALNELTLYDDYTPVFGPDNHVVFVGCNGAGYYVCDHYDQVQNLSKPEAVEQIMIFLLDHPPAQSAHVSGGEWQEA